MLVSRKGAQWFAEWLWLHTRHSSCTDDNDFVCCAFVPVCEAINLDSGATHNWNTDWQAEQSFIKPFSRITLNYNRSSWMLMSLCFCVRLHLCVPSKVMITISCNDVLAQLFLWGPISASNHNSEDISVNSNFLGDTQRTVWEQRYGLKF